MTNDDIRLLTKSEAAARLSIAEKSLDRLRAEGKLPTVHLGKRTVRFRESDVVALKSERGQITEGTDAEAS